MKLYSKTGSDLEISVADRGWFRITSEGNDIPDDIAEILIETNPFVTKEKPSTSSEGGE